MTAFSRLSLAWPWRAGAAALATTALLTGLAGLASPAAASATSAATAAATGSASSSQRLAVTALSFGRHTVDVTGAPAHVRLNWTITDTRAGVRSVSGTLTLAANQPGHPYRYVSKQVTVSFALKGASMATRSGNGRLSRYSYSLDVPRYATVGTARWQVIGMTVRDGRGDKLTLSASQLRRFKAVLTATEIVDTGAPTFISLQFAGPGGMQYGYDAPQYAYSGTGAAPAQADVCLSRSSAGFASGTLRLTGPGGMTMTVSFTPAALDSQQPSCLYPAEATYGQNYLFDVTFPVGTADGAWNPTMLRVTDPLGNVTTATDLSTDAEDGSNTVTVTADDVLSASKFAVAPNPIDDWLIGQYSPTVTMTTAGASGGISDSLLQFANDPFPYTNCNSPFGTPTNHGGGQVSVGFTMAWEAPECHVTGLAITDAAGDVAVYGSLYGAPDPGLDVKQVPDTTAPVATSANLALQAGGQEQLTIGVTTQVAPVDSYYLYIYNSAGVQQTSAELDGGVTEEPPTGPGSLLITFPITSLTPGTYTVGFTITDEGGLSASYGPGASPMPGGPLTFTVSQAAASLAGPSGAAPRTSGWRLRPQG